MMSRVLFVGMNPARKPKTKSGAIRRLEKWASLFGAEPHSFVNCAHDPESLSVDWELLAGCCEHHEKIVALGRFASGCLRKLGINHFEMPHPSGRNRLLNDPEFEKRKLAECRAYLESPSSWERESRAAE